MDTKPTLKERLQYHLDNVFSKGPPALIGLLAALSLLIITLIAAAVTLGGIAQPGESPLPFHEAFWQALMRTLDAGTMGADTGWGFRLMMFLVTLGGIFIISALIGVLTSGVAGKLDELRKGRSKVIERGHIVILGWSRQVFTILSELAEANANQKNACAVILADRDKVEMEDELRDSLGRGCRLRVVCRTGSPLEMSNLNIVSLNTARAVIVVSPDSADPDSEVIKTVLAVTNAPGQRAQPFHVVAEMRDPANSDVVGVIGAGEVEWVEVGDLVARVIAQTCRQSGLSVVYTDLLDFEGDEIYFCAEPRLTGKTYGEALLWFEHNAVLGLAPAAEFADGEGPLNQPMARVLQPGDRLVLLAEDDDRILVNQQPGAVDAAVILPARPEQPRPERNLLLGWNWRAPAILKELDSYVAPGSEVLVVAEVSNLARDFGWLGEAMPNQSVSFIEADTGSRTVLSSLELGSFDHIILLCYSDFMEAQQADARTLITLLHLRDIAHRSGAHLPVVSEMLDIRNRDLAEVARADDFIVSDKLVSLIMAQVTENRLLNLVFKDLFDPEGAEIYLKPAGEYVRLGETVNFYTVVQAACQRSETAFGYRLAAAAGDVERAYGVVLNPVKSRPLVFSEADKIIVLAED